MIEFVHDTDRKARAQERRERAVLRKSTLAAGEHDLHPLHGADAVSLLTRLSAESWALTGRAWPSYARHEIPHRFVPRPRP